MDLTHDIRVRCGVILVDGVPDCFRTKIDSDEHFDRTFKVPIEVNVDADAYATADRPESDYRLHRIVNYDCIAWE